VTNPQFLTEFLLVLIAAALVAVTFERLRLPAILGFLLAGVLIGPNGFGLLVNDVHIRQLSEIGIILLMLTIGLEFSFDRMKGLGNIAVLGGLFQILLSIGIGVGFAWMRGWSLYQGFFLGSVIALSSTAIVLKYLIDRGELDTYHGRIAVSILIFQDLAVVPLLILISGLGDASRSLMSGVGAALIKAVFLVACVVAFSRYALPHLMRRIAQTRSREIFFLTAVVICLGTAWVSGRLGLSLAIGAFLAGFMFANTDFRHQLSGEILPFRHIFVSIFFVSIGLLFDLSFAQAHAFVILWMVGLVIFVNFVVMTVLIIAFGFPPRIAMASGIILSQIGEFSFILMEAARQAGGIDDYLYHVLLSTAFVTMLITPGLFALVPVVLKI